ncbi:MAG: cell division protein FtsL [Porticoccaceae bacterium]|nr:cell division protein FtsL [Porticoccaceae bacterium]
MSQASTILGLSLSKVMAVVWLLMLFSGLSVVYVSHQCRLLYSELAVLEQKKNGLQVAWGQYLIEESALASLHRVEVFAQQKLGMQAPVLDQIVVVKP